MAFQFVKNAKFCVKIKILKFGTNVVHVVIFTPTFKKTVFIFEISALEFFEAQCFMQK